MLEIILVDRAGETPRQRLVRHVTGTVVLGIGAVILLVFTYSMVIELMRGTFFGMSLCILILTFGALVLRDGISLLTNRRLRLRDPD